MPLPLKNKKRQSCTSRGKINSHWCTLFTSVIHVYKPEVNAVAIHVSIEGFGGKRALSILRKIELCQNRSKFRRQFCLGVLINVLHVFPLKLASFLRYYVREKKHIFPRASSRDLLLNEKQKKPFVLLNNEVTTIH